jgi:hypothetical protein
MIMVDVRAVWADCAPPLAPGYGIPSRVLARSRTRPCRATTGMFRDSGRDWRTDAASALTPTNAMCA